jgi:hypothetical protein
MNEVTFWLRLGSIFIVFFENAICRVEQEPAISQHQVSATDEALDLLDVLGVQDPARGFGGAPVEDVETDGCSAEYFSFAL